jgi:predicted DNA-binding transcriptional regulator YafY
MARSGPNERLQRLERLTAALKHDTLSTMKGLARELGVSERTIARDLCVLREQGLPIDADRGRGGGVRLDAHWGVGRLNLSYGEAVDLLISIEVTEKMGSPMFMANLGAVRRQLVASFSPKKRARIGRLKSRIMVGITASTQVQAGADLPPRRVVQALHQGFVDLETLSIRYVREDGDVSEREVEPHYLLLKYPVWYVLAFDRLRSAPRTFRYDRIRAATRTGDTFRLRPKGDFQQSLDQDDLVLP